MGLSDPVLKPRLLGSSTGRSLLEENEGDRDFLCQVLFKGHPPRQRVFQGGKRNIRQFCRTLKVRWNDLKRTRAEEQPETEIKSSYSHTESLNQKEKGTYLFTKGIYFRPLYTGKIVSVFPPERSSVLINVFCFRVSLTAQEVKLWNNRPISKNGDWRLRSPTCKTSYWSVRTLTVDFLFRSFLKRFIVHPTFLHSFLLSVHLCHLAL